MIHAKGNLSNANDYAGSSVTNTRAPTANKTSIMSILKWTKSNSRTWSVRDSLATISTLNYSKNVRRRSKQFHPWLRLLAVEVPVSCRSNRTTKRKRTFWTDGSLRSVSWLTNWSDSIRQMASNISSDLFNPASLRAYLRAYLRAWCSWAASSSGWIVWVDAGLPFGGTFTANAPVFSCRSKLVSLCCLLRWVPPCQWGSRVLSDVGNPFLFGSAHWCLGESDACSYRVTSPSASELILQTPRNYRAAPLRTTVSGKSWSSPFRSWLRVASDHRRLRWSCSLLWLPGRCSERTTLCHQLRSQPFCSVPHPLPRFRLKLMTAINSRQVR